MVGDAQVGKASLVSQFVTSDQQGEEGDNLGGEQGGPGDFQTGLQSSYSRKYKIYSKYF